MSIQEIKKALSKTFQGVLKNIVSLANDSTLESNYKVLKVGEKNTPIQLSEDNVKINGYEVITKDTETLRWNWTGGRYKTNNNSSSNYYMQYYNGYYAWTASDSSPTSLSYSIGSRCGAFHAPTKGTLTNIKISLYALDTGLTDPLKFYVYKGNISDGASGVNTTLIGTSDTITPISGRTMLESKDFSSSNEFSGDDTLYVMLKKDSTSGNQDVYFSVTISGEYD